MINQETFCSAPWMSVRLDWDGQYRPCCRLDESLSKFSGQKEFLLHNSTVDQWMSSEYSQYLRKNLTEGNKLPECHKCWFEEDHGLLSMRKLTNTLNGGNNDISKTWIPMFIKRSNPTNYHLINADVKLSNVCNFSCAMCNPHDSSKIHDQWNRDPSAEFIKKQIEIRPHYLQEINKIYKSRRGHTHLIDILKQPLTNLKILGGEPLLDKEMFSILESQPEKNKSRINLRFITNGSQDLVAAAERLTGYRSLAFGISVDAQGKLLEYMRSGSDWNILNQNISRAKQHGLDIHIHSVLQGMNAVRFTDFLKWVNDIKVSLTIDNLLNPDFLSLNILSPELKQKAIDALQENQNLDLYSSHGHKLKISEIQNIISKSNFDINLYKKFMDFIEWYEKNLPLKLIDLCPEFYNIKV